MIFNSFFLHTETTHPDYKLGFKTLSVMEPVSLIIPLSLYSVPAINFLLGGGATSTSIVTYKYMKMFV